METFATVLTGGMLLGLAGALHCAAMCGGLASGGAIFFAPRSQRHAVLTLSAMMAGRITVYAALGAAFAASAEFSFSMMSFQTGSIPMPWIGAVMLVWIGLTTAGFFPAFSFPTTAIANMVTNADRALAPVRRFPHLAPFATGMVWGLAPCPLIYAALFTAALTGTALNGFIWMLGFGLATIPAVMLPALGIKFLARTNALPQGKIIAGLAIALFGIATLLMGSPVFSALCLPA